jgi:hypothetical protein
MVQAKPKLRNRQVAELAVTSSVPTFLLRADPTSMEPVNLPGTADSSERKRGGLELAFYGLAFLGAEEP